MATETGMGVRPGEEERITADQSKQHVPIPMKAPFEGLSLFHRSETIAAVQLFDGPGDELEFDGVWYQRFVYVGVEFKSCGVPALRAVANP